MKKFGAIVAVVVIAVFAGMVIAGEQETLTLKKARKGAVTEKPAEVKKETPVKGDPIFGVNKEFPKAMKGEVFFIPEGSDGLPDFSILKPQGTIYTRTLNVEPHSFELGFPGIDRTEWFAIRYTGFFNAPAAGEYGFRVLSDDGARVYIDDALVVDNDGVHPPSDGTGVVNLAAGRHRIRVEFFQGPRYELALQLFVTAPGGQEKLFESD